MDQLIEIVSGFVLGLAVITPFLLKARGILKEVGELMVVLAEALEDKKLDREEISEIVEEAQEVLGLFKK